MNKRKLAILLAGLFIVAGIVGGLLADIGVSADGVVTINGNRVWGGTVYVDEVRATGSGGLKLYDDSGTVGVFVEDGGNVGVQTANPAVELQVTGDISATGTITGTAFDTSDGNITDVGDIALDTISADDGSSFSMSNDWTNAGNTIADLGAVTTADINGGTVDGIVIGGASAAAGTFAALVTTSISNTDGNITNVGDINADSVSPDSTTLTLGETDNDPSIVTTDGVGVAVTLGNDAADDFTIDSPAFVVEGDTGNVGIGIAGPGTPLDIIGPGLNLGGTKNTIARFRESLNPGRGVSIGYYSDEQTGYVFADTYTPASDLAFLTSSGAAVNENMRITSTGNVGIGETTPANTLSISGTLSVGNDLAAIAGTYGIVIGTATTTPTMAADTSGFFVADVSGSAEMFVVDEADNATQISPHSFPLFTPDEDEPFPWSYYSCNRVLGKCINADIVGAIRAIEELSGETFIYYEDMPEDEVMPWAALEDIRAEATNAQRLAEAAAVLTTTLEAEATETYTETVIIPSVEVEVTQPEAVESYPETVTQPVSPTEYITTTTEVWSFDPTTGQPVTTTATTVNQVMETVETGVALYRVKEGYRFDNGLFYGWTEEGSEVVEKERLKAGCQLEDEAHSCPTGEEDAVYEPYEPQEMPEWMQARTVALFLAPQDVSGLEKPDGDWKKLTNVGAYAIWAAIGVEAEQGLELHETLWAMSPTETLGALAVVQTRGESMYDSRVRRATGMTVSQALQRRDRIADYLDSLGKDTTLLRAALTEHDIVAGIVDALGATMEQLWGALAG